VPAAWAQKMFGTTGGEIAPRSASKSSGGAAAGLARTSKVDKNFRPAKRAGGAGSLSDAFDFEDDDARHKSKLSKGGGRFALKTAKKDGHASASIHGRGKKSESTQPGKANPKPNPKPNVGAKAERPAKKNDRVKDAYDFV